MKIKITIFSIILAIDYSFFLVKASAALLTYQIAFLGGDASGPSSGIFTYDTTQNSFTSFHVVWNNTKVNLMPNPNSPVWQNYQTGGTGSVQSFYNLLVNGGQYAGLNVSKTWAVYPPNAPGNTFVSQLAIYLFNSDNAGPLTGGGYPDPTYVANYQSGTFAVTLVPEITGIIRDINGGISLNINTQPNSTNRIWTTTNLTPPVLWQSVATNVVGPSGSFDFTDTNTIGYDVKFFRISMP